MDKLKDDLSKKSRCASANGISNVVVCDDHYVSALGIETLLRKHFRHPVQIRTASTGENALEMFRQSTPDLMIVDLELPDISGIELIGRVQATSLPCHLIVLTGSRDPHVLRQISRLNVSGILIKSNTGQNLHGALSSLGAQMQKKQKTYTDSSVQRILELSESQPITKREHEVLELMVKGCTSAEIALKMNCAVTTVKTYRARIMSKSATRNSAEMIAWYLKGNSHGHFGSDT